MDFSKLINKLHETWTINRDLATKLEEAQQQVTAYQELNGNDKSNPYSASNQSNNVGGNYLLYTMDYVHNSELIRGALDLLNLYDGLQFILPDEERADGILKLGQITRHKKFLYKTFTSRKNSKGIIVWRID